MRAAFAASGGASLRLARLRFRDGDVRGAEALLRELETGVRAEIDHGVDSPQLLWLLAAAAAVRGDQTKLMRWYREAVEAGWLDVIWDEMGSAVERDPERPDFVALRTRILDHPRTVSALAARIAGRFDVARASLEHVP